MMQSDSIDALAKALAAAQAEMRNAEKDSENPFFKSTYANLASCWEACRAPLSKNGLCVIQTTNEGESGIYVTTTLAHASGQWIKGHLPLKATKQDPQGIGSAITYARRYALMAIVGIAPDDDDGECATDHDDKTDAHQGQQSTQPPKKGGVSEAQLKRLYAIRSNAGWTDDDVKSVMRKRWDFESSKELDWKQYKELCEFIEKNPRGDNGHA